jgi:hypothetical protein
MVADLDRMNELLRPASPPRVLEGVYTQDQYERMVAVIERHGPWPTITAHHFDTVEELVATSSGPMRGDESAKLTLDDVATAHFRGFFGENSISYYSELDGCFYNSTFLELARDYWGAQYAKPTLMLFNLCGPHHSGLSAHLDAVTFRGVRIENTPVWLQNVMGKSGLFTEYLVKMAQVITSPDPSPKARPSARSCASSNATSHARSIPTSSRNDRERRACPTNAPTPTGCPSNDPPTRHPTSSTPHGPIRARPHRVAQHWSASTAEHPLTTHRSIALRRAAGDLAATERPRS